jgi:hypothetical protein
VPRRDPTHRLEEDEEKGSRQGQKTIIKPQGKKAKTISRTVELRGKPVECVEAELFYAGAGGSLRTGVAGDEQHKPSQQLRIAVQHHCARGQQNVLLVLQTNADANSRRKDSLT